MSRRHLKFKYSKCLIPHPPDLFLIYSSPPHEMTCYPLSCLKKKWRNPQFSSVTPCFQPISKSYKHWLANISRSQWFHTSCSSTLCSKPPLSLVLTITIASWPVFLLTHIYHPHCWLSDSFKYIKLWHNYAQNYPRASYLTQSQIEGNSGPHRGLQGPIWHPPLPIS